MRYFTSVAAIAAALMAVPALAQEAAPTVADAEAFIATAEKDLYDFTLKQAVLAGSTQPISPTIPMPWPLNMAKSAPRKR